MVNHSMNPPANSTEYQHKSSGITDGGGASTNNQNVNRAGTVKISIWRASDNMLDSLPCSQNILVKLGYNLGRKLSSKFGMGLNKPHDIR